MTTIYNDPGSGTFKSAHGSGQFTTQDTNWAYTTPSMLNIDSGAGGNLLYTAVGSSNPCYWNSGSWPITGGLWAEITLANQIVTSAAQVGPFVAASVPGGNVYGYIMRLRYNGSNTTWTVYSYNNSAATVVIAETNFTEPTAPYTVGLQQVYTSPTANTLTAFVNYAQVGSPTVDTVNASTIDAQTPAASGLWPYNGVSGFGDIANMRGGTGLYPGSGSGGVPGPLPPGAKQTFVTETIFQF